MVAKKTTPPRRGPINNKHGNSGRPTGTRASANPDELALRRQRSLTLRLQGMQLRDIAAIVGVSSMVVQGDIKKLIQENLNDADVARARALEEVRLDNVLRTAVGIAENVKGDPELRLKAIDRIVRISAARASLLGLNMPARLDMTVTERSQADIELEELINEAKAKNDAIAQKLKAEAGPDDAAGA